MTDKSLRAEITADELLYFIRNPPLLFKDDTEVKWQLEISGDTELATALAELFVSKKCSCDDMDKSLRAEIEDILRQYCPNCSHPINLSKSTTALEQLFEKRLEPLRKVYEKYIHPDIGKNETLFYLQCAREAEMWQAIKEVVDGDKWGGK